MSATLLLLDKPAGPTSHELVAWVRWCLRTPKVGHCGTLDPGATGLLVVPVGEATKLSPWLTASTKTYEAVFALGAATDTCDAAGRVIAHAAVPPAIRDAAVDRLRGLAGTHELAPPAWSAIQVGGRRAHELARAGEPAELPARSMVVHAVEDARLLEGSDPGVVRVAGRLVVSKGTYVRSLAVHLGQRLGVPAHLQSLRRTACGRVGLGHPGTRAPLVAMVLEPGEPGEPGGRARPPRFRVRPASLPEAGRDEQAAYLRAGALDPLEALDLPLARSTAEAAVLLRQGAPVAASAIEGASEGVCAVVLPDRCLVVGRVSEGCFAPDRLVRLGPLPPHGAA